MRPIFQPLSSLTLSGGDFRRAMVGAWLLSSPGIGGRVHNHAPMAQAHATIPSPFLGTWHPWYGWAFETDNSTPLSSSAHVNLGDPIAAGDDVTVLVGWVPRATTVPATVPPGTGENGTMFDRGQDGAGNGWSIFLRHDGTNQVSFAVVHTSGGATQTTATGPSAGLRPYVPNFAAGRFRQASDVAVFCNGKKLAETATGGSSLRTSTVGCGLGQETSGDKSSHCDPLLFCFLWRRALSDGELLYLTTNPWALWETPLVSVVAEVRLTRDAQLPLEFLGLSTLFRDARLPLEFLGLSTLFRDARLPVSISGALTRDPRLPVDWIGTVAPPRDARAPLAFTGIDPNLLLHRWLVLVKLNAPLLHAWSVHALARTYSLSHQWEVKEPLPALPHRWNVTGDILTPFGVSPDTGEPLPAVGAGPAPGDVQQPVATKDKTP